MSQQTNNSQLTNKTEQQPQRSPKKMIYDTLTSMKDDLEEILPKHLSAERMLQVAFQSIRTNPTLLECTPGSLVGALMQAAQLGLEPDALGSCYLVPYNRKQTDGSYIKEVQFQLGYKGMIELVRRSGQVTSINAQVVHERDAFDFEYGLNERLRHVPTMKGDKGQPKAVYAYARFKDGGYAFTVLSMDEVNEVRDKFSKSKDRKTKEAYGPWKDHYESMAKKTAIKQLIKYMPVSVEVQRELAMDEIIKPSIKDEPVILEMEGNE